MFLFEKLSVDGSQLDALASAAVLQAATASADSSKPNRNLLDSLSAGHIISKSIDQPKSCIDNNVNVFFVFYLYHADQF